MIRQENCFFDLGLLDEQIRLQVIQQGPDIPEYVIQERANYART